MEASLQDEVKALRQEVRELNGNLREILSQLPGLISIIAQGKLSDHFQVSARNDCAQNLPTGGGQSIPSTQHIIEYNQTMPLAEPSPGCSTTPPRAVAVIPPPFPMIPTVPAVAPLPTLKVMYLTKAPPDVVERFLTKAASICQAAFGPVKVEMVRVEEAGSGVVPLPPCDLVFVFHRFNTRVMISEDTRHTMHDLIPQVLGAVLICCCPESNNLMDSFNPGDANVESGLFLPGCQSPGGPSRRLLLIAAFTEARLGAEREEEQVAEAMLDVLRLAHEEEEARDWLACPYAYHPLEPISARVSNTWWTRRGEPLSTVRKLCAAKCQAFWGVNQVKARLGGGRGSALCPFGCGTVETQSHLLGGCRHFRLFYVKRHDQVLRALARALTAAGLKVVVHDSAANARKATQIPEELQARIPAHLRHLRPDLLLAVTTAVRDEDLAKARDGKLAQYRGYCQAAGFDNRALLFGATGCIPGQSVRDLLQLVPGTEHKTLCEALRRISGDLTRSILALFLMRDSDRRDRASTQIHRPAAAPSGFLHPPRHLHGSP
ncbi:hypothetical protein PAPYR_8652 [Paratrimastix pyriformis]|uniref:Uncharacterized protein n=1 Tax=Paratrimastix pyriformis TaxID=342808 RepID=A0ABQ8UHA8_9EUKA|nr:hypothetical protein PAPYR_8652 [Paratrimastix pyriformis]